ncbi:hypothetical protein [Streptomyces sp. NRRL S-350]|uniref:hypothetical protein n=1 Tax=Streptomyces sp. NRRL S-350 TaxID=1463902 RepID=UPI0004C19AB7|nr:hypothetical protein [Streptomyces sp. NRRL S-350]
MPGDAEYAPRELMSLPGPSRDIRRWRLVEIRRGGRWRPAMLTVWRRPPGSAVWVVHVRWAPDEGDAEAWGWFVFSETAIRPLPEPDDPAPARAPFHGVWRDAITVPRELTGTPDPDGADRCWRLAWLRIEGTWSSALVTARRRPGPDVPWIADVRWGEDRQRAWALYDPAAVRVVPREEDRAAVSPEPPAGKGEGA